MKKWYVVRSHHSQEQFAAQNLRDQSFQVFLPLMRRQLKAGAVISPLFPGYLFVKFDINKDRWRSILGTRGVAQLLSSTEDSACPVRKGVIESFKKMTDRKGIIKEQKEDDVVEIFKSNETLQIISGGFAGMTGIVRQSTEKACVLVCTLLSREINVTISPRLVRRLTDPSSEAPVRQQSETLHKNHIKKSPCPTNPNMPVASREERPIAVPAP